MRPQHSHCGPLRGQVELVDENGGGPGVRRCGYGTGSNNSAQHLTVGLRGMVGDLIKAKCRIYHQQIAAG